MYNNHMHLPINTIHWYIGIPFALFIGIRGIMQYKKDGSKLNQYIGLTGLVFALCFLVYGLPALFLEESSVLTTSTILGDILQFVALLFMWAAVVRVFTAKKPFFKGIFIALIGVLFVASVYLSIITNLANPVTITQASDGLWTINFYFSGIYSVVTALQYVSFLLLAAFFASQARFTIDKFKKLRIYSIAAILFVVGAVYVIQPVLNAQGDFRSTTLLLAANLLVAGVFIAATLLLSNRKNK
jgi:hypothetical protein